MTWKLHQQKLKGRRILTNYGAFFEDGTIKADILKTMPDDLVNCDLGMSEIHKFMETRRTQRTDQIMITYVFSEFRKRRINAHWDSQNPEKVERRVLDETDVIIHCENLGCGELDCREQSCGIDTCGAFYYQPWHKRTGRAMEGFYLHGPRDFYPFFDSEAIVRDFVGDDQADIEWQPKTE